MLTRTGIGAAPLFPQTGCRNSPSGIRRQQIAWGAAAKRILPLSLELSGKARHRLPDADEDWVADPGSSRRCASPAR